MLKTVMSLVFLLLSSLGVYAQSGSPYEQSVLELCKTKPKFDSIMYALVIDQFQDDKNYYINALMMQARCTDTGAIFNIPTKAKYVEVVDTDFMPPNPEDEAHSLYLKPRIKAENKNGQLFLNLAFPVDRLKESQLPQRSFYMYIGAWRTWVFKIQFNTAELKLSSFYLKPLP